MNEYEVPYIYRAPLLQADINGLHSPVDSGDRFSANAIQYQSLFGATTPNNTPIVDKSFLLTDGVSYHFEIFAIARDTTSGDTATFQAKGGIKRVAGTVSAIGSIPAVTQNGVDAAASTWTLAVAIDDTTKCLDITMTGQNGKTIDWNGKINWIEVQ